MGCSRRFCATIAALYAVPAIGASVSSFVPQGPVKNINQVTVRFSAPVIPMGDARVKDDPLLGECNAPLIKVLSREQKVPEGTFAYMTKWVDHESWSLDFLETLPSGLKCQFKINPAFKDLRGKPLEGLLNMAMFSFSTGGPAVVTTFPERYAPVAHDQVFALVLDTKVDEKSLPNHVYFEVEGQPGKVDVKWLKDDEKKSFLNREPFLTFVKDQGLLEASQGKSKSRREIRLLKAMVNFPESVDIALHWDKGIKSLSGIPVSEEQILRWRVREDFKARLSCERSAKDRACSPNSDILIEFTNLVSSKNLRGVTLKGPGEKTWMPQEFRDSHPAGDDSPIQTLTFKGPFHPSTTYTVSLPTNLVDEEGRSLTNQKSFPLSVKTDITPPLLKFAAPFGILEAKGTPLLPVSVRNIELNSPMHQKTFPAKSLALTKDSQAKDVIRWYIRLIEKENTGDFSDRKNSLFAKSDAIKPFALPQPQSGNQIEVVGIPLKERGFHVVEVESQQLGDVLLGRGPMYVAAGALVTDMAVHFKLGRESSLIWVTQLDSGSPIKKAEVAVYNRDGQELWKGVTDDAGLARVPILDGAQDQYGDHELFVFAKYGDDLSFVSSNWRNGIEAYRFNISQEYLRPRWEASMMHTVLDRVTVQPGETVNMKHVLRRRVGTGFAGIKAANLPAQVHVVHQGSQQVYPLAFEWDEKTGTALNTFKVPPEAKLGTYEIYLTDSALESDTGPDVENPQGNGVTHWEDVLTGTFRVAEYKLPLIDAKIKIQGDQLVAPADVKVDLSAVFLAGGPAQGLKTKLRSLIRGDLFRPDVPGTSGMTFFDQQVAPGVFDAYSGDFTHESPDPNEELEVQEVTLDRQGGALGTVSGIKESPHYRKLFVEWEYKDPNGEIRTARAEKSIFPSSAAIGIEADPWFVEAGKAQIKGVIISPDGKPLNYQSFKVEVFSNTFFAHRKKLAGGFYSLDAKREIKDLGTKCAGRTDEAGRFSCQLPSLEAGDYIVQASTQDERKRSSWGRTNLMVYSRGTANWYPSGDSDRMDIMVTQPSLMPGDKAKIVVRTPFEKAQALVTVEREGVLDAFVTPLTRDQPYVEVPIKGSYAPNVFISVLAVRGRVAEPQPTAMVDLARPSVKLGLIDVKVGWQDHALDVAVTTPKKVYRTRETVDVHVKVTPPRGKPLPALADVAVIAVDEALLKLKENKTWDILSAMMSQRPLAVETSTGQVQVIGRRHFGLKAQPPGGGGGSDIGSREYFDPMLLWAPRVKLDGKGEATVRVKLNDSMTSFRLVAVALAGGDLFGYGSTNVSATKDLMILSGFVPAVREGDLVHNSITVRNTTSEPMSVKVVATSTEVKEIPAKPDINLGPSESQVIDIPVTVPKGLSSLNFLIKASDAKSGASDSLKIQTKVQPVWRPTVQQATLFQLTGQKSIDIKQPADGLPDQGGLGITARSSLTAGLGGVIHYMTHYPYSCLEQRLSRALALDHKADLQRIIEQLPSFMDEQGLLTFFPNMKCGDPSLTRYVLDMIQVSGHQISDTVESQIVSGLANWVEGRKSCSEQRHPRPFDAEAKIRAIEILSRYKNFRTEFLSAIPITPNMWTTGTVSAFAKLVQRETRVPGAKALATQADQILRSRLNYQGSLAQVQGGLKNEASWEFLTTIDMEALSVFDYALSQHATWSGELGRMARGMLARMQNGVWDSTMANAWGSVSFRRFRDLFEREPVIGTTTIATQDKKEAIDWQAVPLVNDKFLPWPKDAREKVSSMSLGHVGSGKPWIHFQTLAAIPLKSPLDHGYLIKKTLRPVTQKTPNLWSVGDVIDIQLQVTSQADQNWVVIRDPIPAGSSHLGTGLDGSSDILDRSSQGAPDSDWPSVFDEKKLDAFLSYAAELPKGTYTLNYRIRLNTAGTFKLGATRVEAMYAREMFGEAPYEDIVVSP